MCLRDPIRHGGRGGGWGSICDLLLLLLLTIFLPLAVSPWEQLLSVYFVSDSVLVAEDPGMNKTQL